MLDLEFKYLTDLILGHREWTNHRVELWTRDEKIGHITIAFLSEESYKESFGHIDDYVRFRGHLNPEDVHRETYADAYKRFREFHVETAHVGYVWVEEPWRRQGFASFMYIEGARWLGDQHGLMLAASTLQAEGVPALWEKLVENENANTVRLPDGRWAIDGVATPSRQ